MTAGEYFSYKGLLSEPVVWHFSPFQIEPNHALARDSFPYILSTADAVLFFCYNSRKPA